MLVVMQFREYIASLKRKILSNNSPNHTPEVLSAGHPHSAHLARSSSIVSSIYQTRAPSGDRLPRFASRRDYDAWNRQQTQLEMVMELDGQEVEPTPIASRGRLASGGSGRERLLSPVDRVLYVKNDRLVDSMDSGGRCSSLPPETEGRKKLRSPALRPVSRPVSPSPARRPLQTASPSKLNQCMTYVEEKIAVDNPPKASVPKKLKGSPFNTPEKFLDVRVQSSSPTKHPRILELGGKLGSPVLVGFSSLSITDNLQDGDPQQLTIKCCEDHHIHIHLPQSASSTPIQHIIPDSYSPNARDRSLSRSPLRLPSPFRSSSRSSSKPRNKVKDKDKHVQFSKHIRTQSMSKTIRPVVGGHNHADMDINRSRSMSVPPGLAENTECETSPNKANTRARRSSHHHHHKHRHGRSRHKNTPDYSFKVFEGADEWS